MYAQNLNVYNDTANGGTSLWSSGSFHDYFTNSKESPYDLYLYVVTFTPKGSINNVPSGEVTVYPGTSLTYYAQMNAGSSAWVRVDVTFNFLDRYVSVSVNSSGKRTSWDISAGITATIKGFIRYVP